MEAANLRGKDGDKEPGDAGCNPPPSESVNKGASPGWKYGTAALESVILRALSSLSFVVRPFSVMVQAGMCREHTHCRTGERRRLFASVSQDRVASNNEKGLQYRAVVSPLDLLQWQRVVHPDPWLEQFSCVFAENHGS